MNDKPLDAQVVMQARDEEIKFMQKEGVYEKVSLEECFKAKGSAPTSVRWIDTDKGKEGLFERQVPISGPGLQGQGLRAG